MARAIKIFRGIFEGKRGGSRANKRRPTATVAGRGIINALHLDGAKVKTERKQEKGLQRKYMELMKSLFFSTNSLLTIGRRKRNTDLCSTSGHLSLFLFFKAFFFFVFISGVGWGGLDFVLRGDADDRRTIN